MKTSSTRQLELSYPPSEPLTGNGRVDSASEALDKLTRVSPSTSPNSLELPKLGAFSEAYAVTSRMAGRINAASVSEQEHKDMLAMFMGFNQNFTDKRYKQIIDSLG